jgi:hypothetical protein
LPIIPGLLNPYRIVPAVPERNRPGELCRIDPLPFSIKTSRTPSAQTMARL